jgi:hypothetical protein
MAKHAPPSTGDPLVDKARAAMEKYIVDLMADGFTERHAKAMLWQCIESYRQRDIRERRKALHIVGQ